MLYTIVSHFAPKPISVSTPLQELEDASERVHRTAWSPTAIALQCSLRRSRRRSQVRVIGGCIWMDVGSPNDGGRAIHFHQIIPDEFLRCMSPTASDYPVGQCFLLAHISGRHLQVTTEVWQTKWMHLHNPLAYIGLIYISVDRFGAGQSSGFGDSALLDAISKLNPLDVEDGEVVHITDSISH